MNGPSDDAARLLDLAAEMTAGTPDADEVSRLRAGLEGPLRIAIAGRVKAGKSTLLNALVGERLAATDAGECTRVVTRYLDGVSYDVEAIDLEGASHPLVFRRLDGVLSIDLAAFDPDQLARLDVTWPSTALEDDHPHRHTGPGVARRPQLDALARVPGHGGGSAERRGRGHLPHAPPALSRRRVPRRLPRSVRRGYVAGQRAWPSCRAPTRSVPEGSTPWRPPAASPSGYRRDPDVRSLCTTVVAVAALLAESGLTWREDEAAAVRALAATPDEVRVRMLWSAERFCDPASSELTVELRRSLLQRLGLFGLRLLVEEVREGHVTTAVDMANLLVEVSGLPELRAVIDQLFLPQAQVLKARSALVGLRALARRLGARGHPDGRRLDQEVERLEASRPEFGQLRLVHLVRSGSADFTPEETAELDQVVGSPDMASRLGVDPDADADALRQAALGAIDRWRTRAAAPLNDPARTEACESMARIYESIYALA